MKRFACVAVVALLSCQPGDPADNAGRPRHYEPQVAFPTNVAVTPMPVVRAEPVAPAKDVAPPFGLTASDGSGLALTRIDAKAVIQGPLAFSEVHLYFKNPEARTREGTFAITLPSGAAVSRFAMETDGKWQEAEVVEKAVARRVYDDYLHRKQDPALLEKAAGNQFTARVFPIPASGEKHLVVSFSQELAGQSYTLPLRGLPQVGRVDVQLTTSDLAGKTIHQTLAEKNWQPDRDFTAQVDGVAAAVADGNLVVGALAIADAGSLGQEPPNNIAVLVDTSASRALGFASYVKNVYAMLDALRAQYGDIKVDVFAFDQVLEPMSGAQQMIDRGAAGASDLASALAALPAQHARRLVVVTDGVMTAGPETHDIAAKLVTLGLDRVDVVLAGGIRDERFAAAIARAGLPHAGDVFDLDRGITAVVAGLGQPVITDVAIDVPGATWVYPRTLPAARPGSTQMVFAKMSRPTRAIEVIVGNTRKTIGLAPTTPALIERAIAGAQIEEMENKLGAAQGDEAKKLRDEIAKLSVRARVVSSQTSMLVLESDADYARYHIERTTLADVLTVGPSGQLEEQHRTTILAANSAPSDPWGDQTAVIAKADSPELSREQAIEEARSAGILGSSSVKTVDYTAESGSDVGNVLGGAPEADMDKKEAFGVAANDSVGTIGHGAGTGIGYGVGGGRGGMRGRSAAVPSVSIGQPTAQGDLDPAIIRRYIKRNVQKIQYCYEKELLTKPRLHGTVTTTFVISPNGIVPSVSASGVDSNVASCVGDAIKGIEFPHPSAAVQVSYPFTFNLPPTDAEIARQEREDRRQEAIDAAQQAREERQAALEAAREAAAEEAKQRERERAPALTGPLADVMATLQAGNVDKALVIAKKWHEEAPGDVLALIGYGEALEAHKDMVQAARMYGSIIDLFPSRADMRRFAGERLERIGGANRKLIIDTYRKAVADRPDHATGHRLLAYALLRDGDNAGAFDAILVGVDQPYPDGRFLGADRVMKDDAGIIAAVYQRADPSAVDKIKAELAKRSIEIATKPSTRFIMYWETDANDVDFHIRDAHGHHAWYEHKELESGGELYADITTGYGPECFAIEGKPTAGPYKLSINYYSQGPMGYGMGLLQVLDYANGAVKIQDRPYVIMKDEAFVALGTY